MILDVEGAVGPIALSRHRPWMLPLASATVALAVLLVVGTARHDPAPRVTVVRGPSILEQAFATPAPLRLSLDLPSDIAVPLPPWPSSDYGSDRQSRHAKSFRLRGSNDIVTLSAVPDALPVIPPAVRSSDSLAVHGSYAFSWTIERPQLSVLRWTEDGMTYEINSRTLAPAQLARIAELAR